MAVNTLRRRLARWPHYQQPAIIIKLDKSLLGGPMVAAMAINALMLVVNFAVLSASLTTRVQQTTASYQPAPVVASVPTLSPTPQPAPTSVWIASHPHNTCNSIASLQVKFGVQAKVLAEPSRNAAMLRTTDTGDGWLSADAKAGRWWHVCNFGWLDVDDVESIELN